LAPIACCSVSRRAPRTLTARPTERQRVGGATARRLSRASPDCPTTFTTSAGVVRHVADVNTVSSFYEQVLGLDVITRENGSVFHNFGDTTVLELAPGGHQTAAPEDRGVLPNSLIVRIHDFDDYVAHLRAHGARFSGEFIHYDTGTKLAYVADPDGNLTGIEDRTLLGNFVEDLEADRRWRARR
jgi:catechol 2,3-dioxygenase-like lactoylglutathione lyase family enzyme